MQLAPDQSNMDQWFSNLWTCNCSPDSKSGEPSNCKRARESKNKGPQCSQCSSSYTYKCSRACGYGSSSQLCLLQNPQYNRGVIHNANILHWQAAVCTTCWWVSNRSWKYVEFCKQMHSFGNRCIPRDLQDCTTNTHPPKKEKEKKSWSQICFGRDLFFCTSQAKSWSEVVTNMSPNHSSHL